MLYIMASIANSLELSMSETYSSTVDLAQKMQLILIVVGILYGSFITPHLPDFVRETLLNPYVRGAVLVGILLSIQPHSYHLGIVLLLVYYLAVQHYSKPDCKD